MNKYWILLWVLSAGLSCGKDNNTEYADSCNCEVIECSANLQFDMDLCACVFVDSGREEDPNPCAECTDDQVCVDFQCVSKPIDAVFPGDLVGKTFAFMCVLDGTVSQPTGLGPVLKGLLQCEDIPPLGLTILGVSNGGKTLNMVGGSLDSNAKYDPQLSIVLPMPPVDFSNNPLLELTAEGVLEFELEGVVLQIQDLEITGAFERDLSALSDCTFAGLIDPQPLEDLLGSDPCMMIPGICNANGYFDLFVEDLEAVRVDTQIPAQ